MRVEGVCESARARSPLSEPDKVWLTAADALARAASPPFTASPSTHTPHIASILIGGGRVPRDFYVGHDHARTHACLREYFLLYSISCVGVCVSVPVRMRDDTISRVTMSARPRPRKPLTFDRGFLFSRPRCWPDTLSIGNDPALSRHQIHQIQGDALFPFFLFWLSFR